MRTEHGTRERDVFSNEVRDALLTSRGRKTMQRHGFLDTLDARRLDFQAVSFPTYLRTKPVTPRSYSVCIELSLL